MDILINILLGIGIALVALLAISATRPNRFEVSRSLTIAATPEQIYPHIADLRAMNVWNPFALSDPTAVTSYSEPSSGVGARHTFAQARSCVGNIEVTEAVAPSNVAFRLIMTKPMAGDNEIRFTLAPKGSSTDVTWTMSGNVPLLAKVMHLFVSADRMCGGEFEKGLAKLSDIVLLERQRRHA